MNSCSVLQSVQVLFTWPRSIGAACTICDLPVTKQEMEFEMEFAPDGDNPGLDKYHVHIRCFAAWEFERLSAGSP